MSFRSVCRFLGTALLALVTLLVAFLACTCYHEPLAFGVHYRPKAPLATPLLSEQEVTAYRRDGFLVKRQLVAGSQLEALQQAGNEAYQKVFWTDFLFGNYYDKVTMQAWRQSQVLASFAFESNLPSIAAQVLNETTSIRILKDALFVQASNKVGCDFHVDDEGFWPAERDSNGVHFWIALSPMRIAEGGGIRVAKGSHTAEWAEECRQAIIPRTCDMQETHPTCHERLMAVSETHDLEPGDAILWDRWMFHRGEPALNLTEAKLRYTIRYIPSNAKAGPFAHGSVNPGELFHGPYYPQVWPFALEEEVSQFADFGKSIRERLLPFF